MTVCSGERGVACALFYVPFDITSILGGFALYWSYRKTFKLLIPPTIVFLSRGSTKPDTMPPNHNLMALRLYLESL